MPKASRDKGNRRERECRQLLHEMGINARRTYSMQAAHSGSADLITENVVGSIAWEVKGCEDLRLTQWLRQLDRQREFHASASNILAFKQSRRPFMYIGFLDQLPSTIKVLNPFLTDA
jgi:Holliday junction resolvase